jgi:hypothetical protein
MSVAHRSVATDFIDHGSSTYTFLQDPIVDALMQVVVDLGMETWITRRRMMVLERVLESRGILPGEAVETYVPTPEDTAAWRAERDRMVRTVYAVLAKRPGGEDAAELAKTSAAPKRAPRSASDLAGRVATKGPSGV